MSSFLTRDSRARKYFLYEDVGDRISIKNVLDIMCLFILLHAYVKQNVCWVTVRVLILFPTLSFCDVMCRMT